VLSGCGEGGGFGNYALLGEMFSGRTEVRKTRGLYLRVPLEDRGEKPLHGVRRRLPFGGQVRHLGKRGSWRPL
jgi:hypothetical protein